MLASAAYGLKIRTREILLMPYIQTKTRHIAPIPLRKLRTHGSLTTESKKFLTAPIPLAMIASGELGEDVGAAVGAAVGADVGAAVGADVGAA